MLTRRAALAGLAVVLLPLPAAATPEEVAASIAETFGEGPIAEGPIALEVPPLAESGNSVPLTVRIDGPATGAGTGAGGVRRLAVFAEANPRPKVCEAVFGPAAAEALLTTNIRLASTQAVVCVAELADGSLIRAAREVRVVIGACTTLPSRF